MSDSVRIPAAEPAPRAKPLSDAPTFRASWFGHAANDNARSESPPSEHRSLMPDPICNCNDELGENPAPDTCPRHGVECEDCEADDE